ncbi:hypothetical protein Csa_004975 [Cucumis sativus]|uniref:Uncharacterized protein n=1 Tax=Cucumis sativus TaxID=3659 RepID=A0A0A0KFW9_CUCSA|nr:hypothetical protein Csa_004975 [Cucumis sativus]
MIYPNIYGDVLLTALAKENGDMVSIDVDLRKTERKNEGGREDKRQKREREIESTSLLSFVHHRRSRHPYPLTSYQ